MRVFYRPSKPELSTWPGIGTFYLAPTLAVSIADDADPPRLSFRQPMFNHVDAWRAVARADSARGCWARAARRHQSRGAAPVGVRRIVDRIPAMATAVWTPDGGARTEARGAGASCRALSDCTIMAETNTSVCGRSRGCRRTRTADGAASRAILQRHCLGNELARRGYVVLVHDTFTFGSRRMRLADLPGNIRNNLVEANPEAEDEIQRYNQFAANHEHLIAKSLFSAGMTWPGVFVFDDQRAVDYLASRPDVDATRLGCGGLSGVGCARSC